MKQETWWDYFDEDPEEIIGRQVVGLFGEKLTYHQRRINWAYLDWIEEHLNCEINEMFLNVEKYWRPEDGPLEEFVGAIVRQNFIRFEKEGKPRPPWCPPVDPIYFDELEDLEKRF